MQHADPLFIDLVQTLDAGETLSLSRLDGPLRLTQASLLSEAKSGKSWVKVQVKGETYTLCTLQYDQTEVQFLDILFTPEDMATMIISGANSVTLVGTVLDDNEEEEEYDPDFSPDDDDEEDSTNSLLMFDPSDTRFLRGFELQHFGLAPRAREAASMRMGLVSEHVDLRQEEESHDDEHLHDNIVLGLINAYRNSSQERKAKRLEAQFKKLQEGKNGTVHAENRKHG